MTLGLSCSCSQTQQLCQRLSLAQRQTIVQSQTLSIRLSLIQALTEDEYKPKADCPKCGRKMTPVEILSGFNRDANDFTTRCSGCGHRFSPILIHFRNGTSVELPFYCDAQTLDRMRGLEFTEPEQIARNNTAVYRSAIFHHGNLKNAFKAIGIEYTLEKAVDWKNKIGPFLGRLPDTLIAEHAGISVRRVRIMRKKMNVPKYSAARALEEAEEMEI